MALASALSRAYSAFWWCSELAWSCSELISYLRGRIVAQGVTGLYLKQYRHRMLLYFFEMFVRSALLCSWRSE